MPLRFECPECDAPVVTFRRPGESARCGECESEFDVPEDAMTTHEKPTWVGEPGAAPAPTTRARATAEDGRSSRTQRGESFKVGAVLSKGMSIWFRKLPVYVTLTLLVNLPLFLYQWWLVDSGNIGAPAPYGFNTWTIISALVNMTLSNLATATLIYAVFQALRGHSVAIGTCLSYVLARFPMLLAVTLLVSLFTALVAGVAILPGLLLVMVSETLGILLLSICAFAALAWVMTAVWATMAVAVVENPGIMSCLSRSMELTKGYRGRIFLLLLLLGVLGGIVGGIVGAVVSSLPVMIKLLLTTGLTVVVASLSAVVTAVGYHDLRVAAEGIDTVELAAIFD